MGASCASMYGKGRAIGWGAEGANLVEFGELRERSCVRFGEIDWKGAELAGDGSCSA